ncbi:unnamed protein product [Prorocentrum cordatum]|uniref:Uncharacterized protein n=1 Tax=Prorocentrum cordatum TaxID=2364126 RepID=A0ABN9QWP0_9DINO|nr:unnamed protein product [Polarella glacialis]
MSEFVPFSGVPFSMSADGKPTRRRASCSQPAAQEPAPTPDLGSVIHVDDDTPPPAGESIQESFDENIKTLTNVGTIVSCWDIAPTKYNSELLEDIDNLKLKIAETQSMCVGVPLTRVLAAALQEKVANITKEYSEMRTIIKNYTDPANAKGIKRFASDPVSPPKSKDAKQDVPETQDDSPVEDSKLPDTLPDTLPPW